MEQFTDVLIMDPPPKEKPTDHIWPTKRQKMLLKYLKYDTTNMTDEEIHQALKKVINKFVDNPQSTS